MQIYHRPLIRHLKCQLPKGKVFIHFIHYYIPGARKRAWSTEGAHQIFNYLLSEYPLGPFIYFSLN